MPMTPEEKEAQKAASNTRFMQMVFGAAGTAILFGMVGTSANYLLGMASKAIVAANIGVPGGMGIGAALMSSQVLLPVLGLAGIAAIGLGCVYIGAQYMTKVNSLEQETQAQKIAKAHDGKLAGVDIQPTPIEKTNFIPGVTTGDKASEADASNDNTNRLVAANSAMNQAASRIDAGSASRSGTLDQAPALQRA